MQIKTQNIVLLNFVIIIIYMLQSVNESFQSQCMKGDVKLNWKCFSGWTCNGCLQRESLRALIVLSTSYLCCSLYRGIWFIRVGSLQCLFLSMKKLLAITLILYKKIVFLSVIFNLRINELQTKFLFLNLHKLIISFCWNTGLAKFFAPSTS